MSKTSRVTVRFPDEIYEKLEEICSKRRGVTISSIVEAAVKDYLFPPESEAAEALIARHLTRLERKMQVVERGNEILGEAFALFVRVWLTNSMELPEEQKELAERAGGRRYRSYIKVLGERLQAGKCLFDDIPRDVLMKPSEFFEVENDTEKTEE